MQFWLPMLSVLFCWWLAFCALAEPGNYGTKWQAWCIRLMRVILKKRYYAKTVPGREPVRYTASQPGGVGTTVYATVYMDPVLRRHPDLKQAMLNHEAREIRAWGGGSTRPHRTAKEAEPRLTRQIGGVSGFWAEIRRRERMRR